MTLKQYLYALSFHMLTDQRERKCCYTVANQQAQIIEMKFVILWQDVMLWSEVIMQMLMLWLFLIKQTKKLNMHMYASNESSV